MAFLRQSNPRYVRAVPGLLGFACLVILASCGGQQVEPTGPTAAQKPTGVKVQGRGALAQALGDGASIADVAERVTPSVVSISTSKLRTVKTPRPKDPFFERFFGPDKPKQYRERGLGSGVIIDKKGLVVTNYHVVGRGADIEVSTADGREFQAKIIGGDEKSDLAVLQLLGDVSGLRALKLGDSSKLRLGDVVLAVGNPFGVGQTVTMGIVSAQGRADVGIVDYEDFIQTDAAINPGNSGGALVNMRGELVGINTAILSRTGGNNGIGFAIPTAMARPIVETLVAHGRVVRGFLGVLIQDVDGEMAKALGMKRPRGVLISQVNAQGPGAKGGLLRGDVIFDVNGKATNTTGRLRRMVAYTGAGKMVDLGVLRAGKERRLKLKLGRLPGDEAPKQSKVAPTSGPSFTLSPLDDELRKKFSIAPNITSGAVVTGVTPGGQGAEAGLRRGDVVIEVDRQPVQSVARLNKRLQAGSGPVLLLVVRGKATRFVTLGRRR